MTDERNTPVRDEGYAPDRWEFDEEVTRVFGDMLERSIPQYELMRDAVTRVAASFVPRAGGVVVDLGCSHGEALAHVRDVCGQKHLYRGYEVSEPMLKVARSRFDGERGVVIAGADLRKGYPRDYQFMVDCTLLVLTLMFVPINYRQALLSGAFEKTRPGGGIVVVEKVLGDDPYTDDVFNANYHDVKNRSGYTPEDIERKRLSLEGVLVPLPASWNVEMLRRAGFGQVDCFWRWMNFAGFVARRSR